MGQDNNRIRHHQTIEGKNNKKKRPWGDETWARKTMHYFGGVAQQQDEWGGFKEGKGAWWGKTRPSQVGDDCPSVYSTNGRMGIVGLLVYEGNGTQQLATRRS